MYPQHSRNTPHVTKNNSTIFKTITSSVDESRQTLALFNKDWETYKRNWQNANSIGGKLGSIFTPANAITKSDIEAIKAYNSQIDACVTSQTAFNRTMLNASPAAQNLVASYNGGKVSAQGMATAQNAAKASTIGLTIAQTALNAAIGMGIGLLINLVVQGVNKLIHANEEAIEKAEELRNKYEEFKNTNASNVNTLKGLESEFKELSKGVSQYGDNISLTTEQYERYKEIIQQIVGMSPSLAEGYDTENGYIADKNGLLERAIELQEIEYRNELRKITNLENLKTSMSGYIAEYKDALNGGIITDEGNIVGTTIDTDFKNSLWQLFNTNNRENYDGQSMAKDIMESLGIKDIDAEMQKYFNEYGYWQDSWFWNDYCDTIINNLNAVTDSLSFEEVGLDEEVFDQNLEKLESYAESYRDMKDSVEMANNAIQTDLGYIAEYADGYSELSTEQQKFVSDFLKGFNISDITSENAMGFLEYDNDKMASVKSQIKKFVEELSQDESTKEALADLYAIPTDEQSISEFVEQFRNALEIIKVYCEENGIEIPIAITNSEETINELEAQQQRAVDFAKDKFDGYDPTAFFKENSINTKEEVDKWLEIAQAANSAAEAEEKYVQGSTLNETDILIPISKTISDLEDLNKELDNLGTAMANIDTEGKFDLGDLDSIADYFLGLEDVPYDIEAVNNALKSLGDGNASLEEQTDSINTLADQYLKTSGILDTLTQDNAELIKLQLQRMGIVNAEEIVEATLNRTLQDQAQLENILAQYKSIVTGETLTLANVTAQEIQNLIAEGKITNDTANQMAILAIKKQLVNGNTLNTSADINNLISLCQMLGATTTALEKYNQVKNGANGMPQYVIDKYKTSAEKELQSAIKTGQSALKATYTSVPKAIYNGGSNVSKALDDANKAASSSAKETQDTYEKLFDFFERRVDVLNDALELLNSNLENVIGSNAKNQLIDAQIGINKESLNNYTDAINMYQQKANEALSKIPVEFQSKIVDGSVSLTDFIGSGNEDLVNAINDYQNWSDKIADCKQNLAELKQSLRQLELDKFNNIIEEFTKQFDISTNAQDLINKQIDLFEEAGQLIGKGFYEGLIKESESQLSILEQEKQSLINELNTGLQNGLIEKGTDEWLEMVNALNEVDGSILDCKKDIEEFNNSIQELHWDIIDKIQKNFDDLSGEISNLIGLIDDVDVSDAEGIWSTEGLTQLGLYTQEYEKSLYAVKMYEDEIVSLNDAYLRGEYSATEYADKLSELKDAQWDEINASESAKDAIMELNEARIDIMVTAIEEEIDAMKELIDSKKEALDSEKDLYEYRQSIAEKNKSVTDLERQIVAMQNDDTAATVAKRKKLEEELSKAKQDLADYEYEHSIDVQKDALDQQYEDFETEKNAEIEALKATLEDREAVISASFENVKNNANLIGAEIGLIAETHGAIVSNSLVSSWTSGENAIASYGETLSVGTSNFLLNMGNMVQGVYGLQSQSDATAVSLANMYNTSSANLQSELLSSYYSVANLNAVTQTLNDSLINTLNRGYDVSSIVNSLNSVGNAASSAANQVAGLMSALSGSGNTGGYTYTNKYQNDSENKNGIVTVYDSNGNIVAVTTRENAEKNYGATNKYAIKKYAKGGIVTKDDNNPLNNIAKAVGEDTLIAAKEGEVVLKPSEADALLKLAPNIEAFNNYIPKLIPDINMPSIPTYTTNNQQPSVQIHYDNLVQVQGDVNNSNIRQMEQIVDNAITKQFNQFNSSLRKAGVR